MTTFLGLGAMGSALVAAAADEGRPAVVWNRTAERAHALARPGVTFAADPAQAIDGAGDGVVVVCLFDHRSVQDVLDPVADRLAGRTVINLTTTPGQSRELAGWAAGHGAAYLDGAIMAVPAMIGRPGAVIFYSGPDAVFHRHRDLLDRWGSSDFLGTDPGLAALHDMAMLAGMYTMIAGFLHGTAMVATAGVSAVAFADRQGPFLAAMAGQLAGYAATIDAGDYRGEGQQSLRFTGTALAVLLEATADEGVTTEILRPVHDLVRRQITGGFGDHGTARIYEELRSAR